MIGTLAQMIALTSYGNNYLKNGIIPQGFDSLNTTFQFCNKVDFREFKKRFLSSSKEMIVANSPSEWFAHLKANDCKQLRLYYESSKEQSFAKDHKLAGLVGGGGVWFIEAIYENHSKYWEPRWEVTNETAIDRKIWTVNYSMLVAQQKTNNLQIAIQPIKDELKHTLNKINDFALKQNLHYWAEQFDKAISVLDNTSPEKDYYHKDLIPLDNYSLTAKQIVFSAGSAWVFGGMGSWNDLSFDNKEDNAAYEELSAELYKNINDAIIAGINTY